MTIDKLANSFYNLCLAKSYGIDRNTEGYELLLKINNSPYHYLATSEMSDEELALASKLEERNWVEFVPAKHGVSRDVERDVWGDPIKIGPSVHTPISKNLPARYVITGPGSFAIATFDWNTLSEEEYERAELERRKRMGQL